MSTAVSLAKAQNTGNPNAGINRAKAITQIFGANAATVLATPNMIRIEINSLRRSNLAKYAVRNGPNAATVKANKVTSNPAWGIVTSRSRASAGNRPTMMNSVVSTVKPAADNRRMGRSMWNSRKTTTPATARRPTGGFENEDGESYQSVSDSGGSARTYPLKQPGGRSSQA